VLEQQEIAALVIEAGLPEEMTAPYRALGLFSSIDDRHAQRSQKIYYVKR
jgi:hypothetical protein